MKYIRVVLAVADEKYPAVMETLDEYIECEDGIVGAYLSDTYPNREDAIGRATWRSRGI